MTFCEREIHVRDDRCEEISRKWPRCEADKTSVKSKS